MTTNKRQTSNNYTYCLIQDDDSHWYLCPSHLREEAAEYFAAFYDYIDNAGKSSPIEPDYLIPIDGYHTLEFSNPQIRKDIYENR